MKITYKNPTLPQHTPGPWLVHQGVDYLQVIHEGKLLDHVIYETHYPDDDDQANAHFIAAAPELLAALVAAEEVVKACANLGSHFAKQVLPSIQAAIAKATPEGSG